MAYTLITTYVQAGIEPDAARFGSTPLLLGCFLGANDIVQLLLDAHADPNFGRFDSSTWTQDRDTWTETLRRTNMDSQPLKSAVDAGHVSLVPMLLDAGAKPSNDLTTSIFKSSGKFDWGTTSLSRMLDGSTLRVDPITAHQQQAAGLAALADALADFGIDKSTAAMAASTLFEVSLRTTAFHFKPPQHLVNKGLSCAGGIRDS